LLSCAAASFKAKSATKMNQFLSRLILCKDRHEVQTTQEY
jgi:hypothetical protein